MKRFPDVPKFPLPAGTKRSEDGIPASDIEDEALDAALVALGDRRRAKAAAGAPPATAAAQRQGANGNSVAAADSQDVAVPTR